MGQAAILASYGNLYLFIYLYYMYIYIYMSEEIKSSGNFLFKNTQFL